MRWSPWQAAHRYTRDGPTEPASVLATCMPTQAAPDKGCMQQRPDDCKSTWPSRYRQRMLSRLRKGQVDTCLAYIYEGRRTPPLPPKKKQ